MEYRREDLLTYEEFKKVMTSEFPDDIAKIIGDKLLKYCLLNSEGLYIMNEDIAYVQYVAKNKDMENAKIKTMVTQLMNQSFKKFSSVKQEALRQNPKFPTAVKNSGITYFNQLITYIRKEDEVDGNSEWLIQFKNGFFDIRDNTFKKREIGKHFISRYIKRDYVPSTKEDRKKIQDVIDVIYKNKEDREFILSHLGRALSGKAEHEQINFFLLGLGDTGKSFIMKMMKATLEEYVEELDNRTFEKGNPNKNKILNEFANNKVIRVAWINELSDKKMDDALFKTFCEGSVKTTKLWKDGSYTVKLLCKLFFTSNHMPNLVIDSGSRRRILAYFHQTRFVDGIEEKVDHSKNMHLKNAHLLAELTKHEGILNAFFDILIKYCIDWKNNKAPKEPKSFAECKDAILSVNDIFADFVSKMLDKTNQDTDRIGKNKMAELVKEMYPEKHFTTGQILASLQQLGIKYNPKYRCDGMQGAYICVKIKKDELTSNDGSTFFRTKEDKYYHELEEEKEKNKALELKIAQLEKELNELKKQVQEKEECKPKPKPKQKKDESDSESEDEQPQKKTTVRIVKKEEPKKEEPKQKKESQPSKEDQKKAHDLKKAVNSARKRILDDPEFRLILG